MEHAYDILVIGELNIDLILNDIDSFPEMGTEKISRQMDLVMGSSSAIFACNSAALGNRVGYIGKIGDDSFGELILRNLKEKGVDDRLIIRSRETHTGATVVLNYDQDRAMITYPGAMEELVPSEIPVNEFSGARHLHLSSYFLQKGIQPEIREIFAKAKENGLTTSIDMQWDPDEKWEFDFASILPHVDIFLPNEAEAIMVTGEPDLKKAVDKLGHYGHLVAVKCGSNGSWLWNGEELVHLNAYLNSHVVDAIGAGDSFNAGFIHRYLAGAAGKECLDFANLMGALSTTAPGGTAAFSDPDQIMNTAKTRFGYGK